MSDVINCAYIFVDQKKTGHNILKTFFFFLENKSHTRHNIAKCQRWPVAAAQLGPPARLSNADHQSPN